MTMNSPDSLLELYYLAASKMDKAQALQTAELMREAGLKCISFNGVCSSLPGPSQAIQPKLTLQIPRTINMLGAFRASLPKDILTSLSTQPTRAPSAENIDEIRARGLSLWNSIYAPFEVKLYDKLADSHPNLPVHILNCHYGALLSDPANGVPGAKIGRVLTSCIAISCLRAQTGVGPQVTSHVFGLRKAYVDGTYQAQGEEEVKGGKWLASDEGNLWILRSVDSIVEAIGQGTGTTFASSKL
ncbi:MAG: hypothetical protein M1818_007678 [Claussenomyces sp. TS43310]|nr:MAG: hypothetical protein M1818_007678 [Claussenomyces sp. TS43310]